MSDSAAPRSVGLRRFRTRMASGVFVLIPVVITVIVVRAAFRFTAGILLPVVDPAVSTWPWAARAALSVAVLLVAIYLLGTLATHVVGQRVLSLGEALVLKVPFVKVVYSASKQVVAAFGTRKTKAFRSVVFVQFPHPGMRSVGFVTATFTKDGEEWVSVFVPTTPNPTTGFLQLLPRRDVEDTELTVEEGIKLLMSLGALMPAEGSSPI